MSYNQKFLDMVNKNHNQITRAFQLMLEPGIRLFIHYELEQAYVKNASSGFLEVVNYTTAKMVSGYLQESKSGSTFGGLWKSFKIKTIESDSLTELEFQKLYDALSDSERGWEKWD